MRGTTRSARRPAWRERLHLHQFPGGAVGFRRLPARSDPGLLRRQPRRLSAHHQRQQHRRRLDHARSRGPVPGRRGGGQFRVPSRTIGASPKPKVVTKETTAYTRSVVRTGTGDIALAAATDIDLTNGAPVYRDLGGDLDSKGFQVGGTAVYTAGHRVDPAPFTVVDSLTGESFTIDPTQFDQGRDFIENPPVAGYLYGAGGNTTTQGTGLAGVLLADPVFADGGGDVTLAAGRDVKGRRDLWQEARIDFAYDALNSFLYSWIGTADQAWRSGVIGNASVVRIDPQLFQEGVGALGGGDIRITRGPRSLRHVDRRRHDADHWLPFRAAPPDTLSLWTFGGGSIFVCRPRPARRARRNRLGRRRFRRRPRRRRGELRERRHDLRQRAQAQADRRLRVVHGARRHRHAGHRRARRRRRLRPAGRQISTRAASTPTSPASRCSPTATSPSTISAATCSPRATARPRTPRPRVYPGTLEATALTGDLKIDTSGGGAAVSGVHDAELDGRAAARRRRRHPADDHRAGRRRCGAAARLLHDLPRRRHRGEGRPHLPLPRHPARHLDGGPPEAAQQEPDPCRRTASPTASIPAATSSA